MHRKLLTLIILILLLNGGQVLAQASPSLGLAVSPQVFEMDVFAGEKIERKIAVKNIGSVALPIAVRVADFSAKEGSGDMVFFDEADEDASISSRKWFEMAEKNLLLEPGEKKEIDFSIIVPREAERGGHYSLIIFEPLTPDFYFRTGQPRAVPVIGSLFLLSVKTLSLEPETAQKLKVVDFSIPEEQRFRRAETALGAIRGAYESLSSFASKAYAAEVPEINVTEKAPASFSLKIKNNDVYHLKPSGKIFVYNFWGRRVGEFSVPQKTILPGKTREFPVEASFNGAGRIRWLPASVSEFLTKNFFVGRYKAVLQLEEAGREESPKDTDGFFFWSFPWKFWLPLLFTFVLLSIFATKHSNRIKLALKAFLGK